MSISTFLNSYIGMYMSQAFCHSVVASIISDQALRAWNFANPAIRQRFRVIVVLLPIFSFPLYQLFNPARSSVQFRQSALFDISRWLDIEIWGVIPVAMLFLALLALTSLVFVLQEMVPILMHLFESKNAEQEGDRWTKQDEFLKAASRSLSMAAPDIVVIEDEDMIIYSTTGKKPAIILSDGIIGALTADELQASLAHELAHIARSGRPVLLIVFILRIIMFFNPVSLVEFRRAVRNEEKICDDIAIALTNRPEALASALKKFFPAHPPVEAESEKKSLLKQVPLEEYSHSMQLESRIARLAGSTPKKGSGSVVFTLTILVIVTINYFVV